MKTEAFYAMLGADDPVGSKRAVVYGTHHDPRKPSDHQWFEAGPNQAGQIALAIMDAPKGVAVYVTMASFVGSLERFKGRSGANVAWLFGFWIDIDVKADDGTHTVNSYATQAEAADALKRIVGDYNPTAVVATGSGGFHVYWVIAGGLSFDQWKPRTAALELALAKAGFVVDPVVTKDVARVMRAASSHHQRTGKVVQGRIIGEPLALTVFDELIGFTQVNDPAKYDTAVNDDVTPTYDSQPADFERILCGCSALAAMVRDPKALTPDLWFAGMQIARHCTNPAEALRQISETHPKWDEAKDTRRMMSLDKGPAKCAAIRWAGGAGCEGCKHAGRGSGGEWVPPGFGTPVMLGRGGLAVVGEVLDVEQDKSADLQLMLPDWATRRVQGEDGKWHTRKIRPHNTSENVAALAKHHGWSIQYNVMSKRTELVRDGVLVAGDDADNVALTVFGDDAVRAGLARDGLSALVDAVAVGQSFHPVLNWIKNTPWDGQDRRQAFYCTLTLAQPSKATLAYKLMDKWMLQGIGALVEPKGIAASGLLVLCGPQYVGKSYWALHLLDGALGAVGTGLGLDPKEKDSVLRAIRFFVNELAELDGTFRRADIASLKGFLTDGTDTVRLSFPPEKATAWSFWQCR